MHLLNIVFFQFLIKYMIIFSVVDLLTLQIDSLKIVEIFFCIIQNEEALATSGID